MLGVSENTIKSYYKRLSQINVVWKSEAEHRYLPLFPLRDDITNKYYDRSGKEVKKEIKND